MTQKYTIYSRNPTPGLQQVYAIHVSDQMVVLLLSSDKTECYTTHSHPSNSAQDGLTVPAGS
jgi:hypothetical protein